MNEIDLKLKRQSFWIAFGFVFLIELGNIYIVCLQFCLQEPPQNLFAILGMIGAHFHMAIWDYLDFFYLQIPAHPTKLLIPFVFSPLVYGLFFYFVDRFLLIRVFRGLLVRVFTLLLLFVLTAYPFI